MADFTLLQEQDAFDAQLDDLCREHPGEYVLMKGGKPISFFAKHEDAYADGLDRFGLDTVFLVGHAVKKGPETVSISWDAGVMFE